MPVSELLPADPMWIGEVQVVGRLGEGGMGLVYLGRQRNGDAVAIKVMRKDLASNADLRRRFALEVDALRDLGGIYTAEVLAADTTSTQPWLVMEFVQGGTLADYITRNGAMPADEFDAFARSLLRAVRTVAGAGVVHRDLKPSNVVLSPEGVRLLDFGVARFRGEPRDTAKAGSLTWMAPEQLDTGQDDSLCDVHAVGMLLYFAASGRHVYGYGDPESVAWRIRNTTPQLVDLPEYAQPLLPLLQSCLAKNPQERPSLAHIHRTLDPVGAHIADRTTMATPSRAVPAVAATAVGVGGSPASAGASRTRVAQPAAAAGSTTAGTTSRTAAPVAAGRGAALPGAAVPITALPGAAPPGTALPGAATPGTAAPGAAPAAPPKPGKSTDSSVAWHLRKVRRLALVGVVIWFVGWTVGIWPLGGPLAPTQAASCVVSAQPADFASGTAYLRSGGGVVSQSILGYFPGPFGEVRLPADAVACQLGTGVSVECAQPTLPDGAVVGCRATDVNGQQVPVNVTRNGDTWSWVLV